MAAIDPSRPVTLRERLPLVIVVVAALVTWVLTQYYLDVGNVFVTVAVLVVVAAVSGENLWLAGASFFTGLALELYIGGREQEAYLFGAIILFFTILQLIAFLLASLGAGGWRPKLAIGLNIAFALAGILLGYYINIQRCDLNVFGLFTPESFVGQWGVLTFCPILDQMELIYGVSQGTTALPEPDNIYIYWLSQLGRFFVLFPFTWGALFAAIVGLRFDLLRPLRLVGQFFRVFFGAGFYAIPLMIALYALYYFELLPDWRDQIGAVLVGGIIFLFAYRMGRRAYRGPAETA